ncbi:hypothetical protein BT96DRAFT_1002276 [Gymnopus androsaceus JB14]|uniref:Fungal-type protein kinase domain-containing protein n=1 Tax=Gymnopus androsaceus JB14 TaxID=1447944 RepID=A0A6A4GYC9_9AGAR|nr:hypothetical protein BT96DRAFT_1002276 [Gymnopus androsaceus JB14]
MRNPVQSRVLPLQSLCQPPIQTRNHHSTLGLGMRCFVAVDCDTMKMCVLKDTWRIAGYHREGEVYQRLHKNSVGESRTSSLRLTLPGHRILVIPSTRNGKYPATPLSAFKSTWELKKVMLDAVEAHRDVIVKAGIHHGDVSEGNIIIVRPNNAPPIWLSHRLGALLLTPQGTLQFMAARLLTSDPVSRTIGDDLESFMLVYLWIAVFYAPKNMSAVEHGQVLELFDSRNPVFRRSCMSSGHTTPYNYRLRSTFLRAILMKLMHAFSFRYSAPLEWMDDNAEEHKRNAQKVEMHDFMIQALEEGLRNEEWKAIADHAERTILHIGLVRLFLPAYLIVFLLLTTIQ